MPNNATRSNCCGLNSPSIVIDLNAPIYRPPETDKTFRDGAIRLLWLSGRIKEGAMPEIMDAPFVIDEEPDVDDLT